MDSKSQQRGEKIPTSTSQALRSLHPCLLPNLRTLVLTNIPASVPKSSPVVDALKNFISACADESTLSLLLAETDYSLPPGRARHAAELEQARSLFALRTIVLEMEQPKVGNESQRRWRHAQQQVNLSENLWTAAQNDFSFFGEEGEEQDECGIYQHDPEKYFPTAHLDDKIMLSPDEGPYDSATNSPHGSLYRHGTLSMHSMNYGGGTLHSPRNLPLGRNQRSSNESQRSGFSAAGIDTRNAMAEMQGGPVSPQLMTSRVAPTSNPIQDTPKEEEEPKVDVVAELAAWRKEKKKAYEEEIARYRFNQSSGGGGTSNAFAAGSMSRPSSSMGPRGYGYGFDDGAVNSGTQHSTPSQTVVTTANAPSTDAGAQDMMADIDILSHHVEGHWKGEIKVVRNPAPKGRTGVVDMYGNYFEKGYLYP
jgi:hypothetical protein